MRLVLFILWLRSCWSLRLSTASKLTPRTRLDAAVSPSAVTSRRRRALGIGALAGALLPPARARADPSSSPTVAPSARSSPLADGAVTVLMNSRTGTEVVIVGTAHISNVSAVLVGDVINCLHPDLIMLELDAKRVSKSAAARPTRAAGEARAPGLAQRLGGFVVGAVLKTMYASLEKLGFDTGAEFVVAMERAATMSIPVLLADRDVDETLRALADAARATTPEEVTALNERLLAAGNTDQLFATNDRAGIASSVELIKQRDTVRGFVDSLRESTPKVYAALVDDRDEFMTQSLLGEIARTSPKRIVCVVGLAHEDGITKRLQASGFTMASQAALAARRCPAK